MPDNTLQDNFLQAVGSLRLKFPVAEIAEKTGYGQPTVSTYLNSKQEVSAKFLKSFCEAFGLDYERIKAGPYDPGNMDYGNITTSKPGQFSLVSEKDRKIRDLEKEVLELKEEKKKLMDLVDRLVEKR